MNEFTVGELTKEEKDLAKPLLDQYGNLVLMKGKYESEESAFICSLEPLQSGKDDDYLITPLFMVITEDKKIKCQDAYGVMPS